ncbi:Pyridinium-3,5-bisthiocarboxylic acid mononucleotide nickel insertion protein [bioreactor metagenome]|uniref:Pyridinium-3,5-bisthiocarboxylic acid mononucleotide nickel insertion protein n=1 Tax=bioreactor metagenome TaxID=1076179 RepID=A0A644Z1D7_9ZZZZ
MKRILVLDSVGGASGDMILGLLAGLGVAPEVLQTELEAVIPDRFRLTLEPAQSHGISGLRMNIESLEAPAGEGHNHHHGRDWRGIRALIERAPLEPPVREMALAVFAMLAEAEGAIHGVPAEKVHFHEIGAVDSLVDIIGCALAFRKLRLDGVVTGVLPTGYGTFHCAHGVYPLPAPATLAMLEKGHLRHESGGEPAEMLTPTGAALLAAWPVAEMPGGEAKLLQTANSIGHREYRSRPNLLRGRLYEIPDAPPNEAEFLWQLECNIDDATPEILAEAVGFLLSCGAADVWQEAIVMKKNRLAAKLCVLCPDGEQEKFSELLLRRTTSFGVRMHRLERRKLTPEFHTVNTEYGAIRIKIGRRNGEIYTMSPEFEDCRRAAEQAGVAVRTVYRRAEAANEELFSE